MAQQIKNVVLVHGAFADGSGWEPVASILTGDGYKVSVVQHPETSYADDQKYTKAAIDALDGPVVLVGHSYRRAHCLGDHSARAFNGDFDGDLPVRPSRPGVEARAAVAVWRVLRARRPEGRLPPAADRTPAEGMPACAHLNREYASALGFTWSLV